MLRSLNNMQGSTVDAMSDAIEGAAVMLYGVSAGALFCIQLRETQERLVGDRLAWRVR